MLKDGKPYYLTFDESVSLHRQMWNDMFVTYGDNPDLGTRMYFKKDWLEDHGYSDVRQDCFLCEYVTQMSPKHRKHSCFMADCPIKWDDLCQNEYQGCVSTIVTIRNCYDLDQKIYLPRAVNGPIYGIAAISDILALPVREKMDWEDLEDWAKEKDLSINRKEVNNMKYRASIEKIETLRNKGCSASDIAKQLGLAESQVRSILRELEEYDKATEFEIGGTQEEVLKRIKDDEARVAESRKTINKDTYCVDCERSIYGEYADCDTNVENNGIYVHGNSECYCKVRKDEEKK